MNVHKRSILDAATRIIEREGIPAMTFRAVAAEGGMTHSGVMHHFRSGDELLLALHEYQSAHWHAVITDEAGKDVEDATDDERLAAYVRACGRSGTRAGLLLLLEASQKPEHMVPWSTVIDRWTATLDAGHTDTSDRATTWRLLARVAANGLWMHRAFGDQDRPGRENPAITELLTHQPTGTRKLDRSVDAHGPTSSTSVATAPIAPGTI